MPTVMSVTQISLHDMWPVTNEPKPLQHRCAWKGSQEESCTAGPISSQAAS